MTCDTLLCVNGVLGADTAERWRRWRPITWRLLWGRRWRLKNLLVCYQQQHFIYTTICNATPASLLTMPVNDEA